MTSIGLFVVTPGQQRRRDRSHAGDGPDQADRRGRLAAAADHPLASGARTRARRWPVGRDLACIALSAEQVGAAARALELTTGYTKTRIQFGRPIASFQAIQFRLAELYALVESARELSYRAASAASAAEPGADLPLLAAAAKAYCSEVLPKWPPRRSSCTERSASPGSTTHTATSSGRTARVSCLARRPRSWPGSRKRCSTASALAGRARPRRGRECARQMPQFWLRIPFSVEIS